MTELILPEIDTEEHNLRWQTLISLPALVDNVDNEVVGWISPHESGGFIGRDIDGTETRVYTRIELAAGALLDMLT